MEPRLQCLLGLLEGDFAFGWVDGCHGLICWVVWVGWVAESGHIVTSHLLPVGQRLLGEGGSA